MSEMALQLIRRAKEEGWKRLDLGNTGIVGAVPEEVGELKELEELSIVNQPLVLKRNQNDLRQPNWITELSSTLPPNLKKLDISDTKVTILSNRQLPESLVSLHCRNTWITNLKFLDHLKSLEEIQCQGTDIENIDPIKKLLRLNLISVSGTKVSSLLPLRNLSNLQHLEFYSTEINDLWALGNLNKLEILNLDGTQVKDLRPLKYLKSLKRLKCSETPISNLKELAFCKELCEIDISFTQINDLSPLQSLEKLESIIACNCNISSLIPLENLSKLEFLILANTSIDSVSPLSNLQNLKLLTIWGSNVKDLSGIKNLIENGLIIRNGIVVGDNKDVWGISADIDKITNPPPEIAKQGNAAILAYWAEQDRKKTIPANEIKLFLLGNSTAGKSTFRDGLPNDKWVNQDSTKGAKLDHNWTLTTEGIKVNIWDFGGQEYYHSTHSLYLGSNSLYATVVDPFFDKPGHHPTPITYFGEREPKEELLEHFPHDYWLEMVAKNNPQNTVFLIWNKLDQDNLLYFGTTDHDRNLIVRPGHLEEYKISLKGALKDKLPEWTGRWALLKTDLANAAKTALKGQEWITYWPVIKADLENESKTRLEMPLDEFKKRCAWWANHEPKELFDKTAKQYPMEDAVWGNIVIYLREMTGTILYWPDGDLKDQVFINPHKINELIYAILNREAKDNEGRFNHAHAITQIPKGLDVVYGKGNWTENPEKLADTVLKIMQQFGIVFEVAEDPGEYVAPQYLGKEEPDLVKDNQEEYFEEAQTIEFVFSSYIPRHIIPQFIARKGKLAESKKYWKYGILFRENRLFALVQAFYDLNIIRLKVEKGEGDIELIRKIYEGLKELWGDSSKIRIKKENGESVSVKELELHRSPSNRICRTVDGGEVEVKEFLPFLPEDEFRRYYTPMESKPMNKKRHIHICYSDTDKDKPFLESLVQNFRAIGENWDFTFWSQADIIPGSVLKDQVKMSISKAEVFIFLMSIDLIAAKESNIQFDYSESTKQALERNCLVIPIKIRSFFGFENQPIGKYPTPLGVEVLNLEKDIDQAWEKVITWMVKVFDQVNSSEAKGIESPSILQIAQGMDKKLDELRADSKKQIEQNEVILNRVNDTYSRLMHKLQSMSDFDNEAYQKLTILGEKTYWSVLASQEQFEDRNAELDLVLQSIIAKIAERCPETAAKLNADLAPTAELSKGRNFLQAIKLKLPVIGIIAAMVATGGPAGAVGAGAVIAAAFAGSVELETNVDQVLQNVIGAVKWLDEEIY